MQNLAKLKPRVQDGIQYSQFTIGPCLAMLLCGAAACGWGASGGGAHPEMPLWKHRPSGSLSVSFRKPLHAESRRRGEPHEYASPALDVARGKVFVGSSDHGLYALRARDGTVLWRFETAGPVHSTPLYERAMNAVFFGSHDGALYAVDAHTGALLWRFMTNSEIRQAPVLVGGILYAVNANDTLVAVDPATGKLRWSQHRTPAAGLEIAGYSGPLVYEGKVYLGFSDGVVMAYDALTGAARWEPVDLAAEAEQLLGELPQYFDVDTSPVGATTEAGPTVFVGSYAAGIFALDADTGIQIWNNVGPLGTTELVLWHEPAHVPRGATTPALPIPARTLLLASSGTTGLWALDPDTGTVLWHRPLPFGAAARPVPIQGALLLSATSLGLFLISPLDGSIIDGLHLGDGITAPPAAHGTRAFVLTNRGMLLGLHVQPPRW